MSKNTDHAAAANTWTALVARQGWDLRTENSTLLAFIREQGLESLLVTSCQRAADLEAAGTDFEVMLEAANLPRQLMQDLGYTVASSENGRLFWNCGSMSSNGFRTPDLAWHNAWRHARLLTCQACGLAELQLDALAPLARAAVLKFAHGKQAALAYARDIIEMAKRPPSLHPVPRELLESLGYTVDGAPHDRHVWLNTGSKCQGDECWPTEEEAWADAWRDAQRRAAEIMGISAEEQRALPWGPLTAVVKAAMGDRPEHSTAAVIALRARWGHEHGYYTRPAWKADFETVGIVTPYWSWVLAQVVTNGGLRAHCPRTGAPLHGDKHAVG